MEQLNNITAHIKDDLLIGHEAPIVVQTMCNTHTSDVEASVAQCVKLYEAGAQMIRLTYLCLPRPECSLR